MKRFEIVNNSNVKAKSIEYPELPFVTVDKEGELRLVFEDNCGDISCVLLSSGVEEGLSSPETIEEYFMNYPEEIVDSVLTVRKLNT